MRVEAIFFFFIRVPVGILFSVIAAKCYSCTTQPCGSYDKNNNKKIYHGKKTLIRKINNQLSQDINILIALKTVLLNQQNNTSRSHLSFS